MRRRLRLRGNRCLLGLASFLLSQFVYTSGMSVTHEKTMLKAFDANVASRAMQLARETLVIEADAIVAGEIKERQRTRLEALATASAEAGPSGATD